MTTSERPAAAIVRRVDLSAPHSGMPAARNSEAELIYAYASTADSHLETRACACGGEVTADTARPALGVAAHQFTARHRGWRLAHGLAE